MRRPRRPVLGRFDSSPHPAPSLCDVAWCCAYAVPQGRACAIHTRWPQYQSLGRLILQAQVRLAQGTIREVARKGGGVGYWERTDKRGQPGQDERSGMDLPPEVAPPPALPTPPTPRRTVTPPPVVGKRIVPPAGPPPASNASQQDWETYMRGEEEPPQPRRPAPARVDDALIAELEELGQERRISTWEHDFLESVTDQVKAGRTLSEKQQAIVDRIKEKVGWA